MTDPLSSTSSRAASATPSSPSAPAASPLIQAGARWFWWIAGLSLVNVVMAQSGSQSHFVVGLAMTELAGAMFAQSQAVGFVIDALVIGFFVLMGQQAQRGRLWAFYAGAALYVVDALIYASYRMWMPLAFHAVALYFIGKGALALRQASTSSV